MITIYHNTSCSKSCNALNALKQTGEPFELIEYLKDIPSVAELTAIVKKLNCSPHELIRTTESIYLEKFKGLNLTDEDWIKVMHENPILIQRPIVVKGDRAIIARTADSLQNILDE